MSNENTVLPDRLDASQTKLEQLQKKLNKSTTITTIIAVVLLAVVAGYFYYGHREISDLLEPKNLVSLGAVMIDDQVLHVRQTLQSEVDKNAPAWAAQLSDQVVDSAPTIREALEEYVLGQTDSVVQQLSGVTETEFRGFLQNDKERMEVLLQEMSSDQEPTAETLVAVETAMDEALQGSTQEQANLLLATLYELRAKMDKLAIGRGLSNEEALERQTLMVIRRLQLSQDSESILNVLPSGLSDVPEPEESAPGSAVAPDTPAATAEADPQPASKPEDKPEDKPQAKPEEKPEAKPEEKGGDGSGEPEKKPADAPEPQGDELSESAKSD